MSAILVIAHTAVGRSITVVMPLGIGMWQNFCIYALILF